MADAISKGRAVLGGFCHEIGLNSVSCSPSRVPIARLAAARANLKDSASNHDR